MNAKNNSDKMKSSSIILIFNCFEMYETLRGQFSLIALGMSESMNGSRIMWAGKTPPPAYTSRPSSSLNEVNTKNRRSNIELQF